MKEVTTIILGGGQGTRLYPLTKHRAKPAIPLGGKYRLIDIPLSNCINSDLSRIYVLTQFNSASLNQHVNTSYRFSPFSKGFVEIIAAQQTADSPDWFQGTADAVRKTLWLMEERNPSEYLVLSGDHLYKMDYSVFIRHHRDSGADVTISVLPVTEKQASEFGVMKLDGNGRVMDFKEKPQGEELLGMRTEIPNWILDPEEAKQKSYIASMGIYVFKREVLKSILEGFPNFNDFGKHVIPHAIKNHKVQAYIFHGYWEDIGTIESFYKANLGLVKHPNPSFSFFDESFPIFTRPRFLPATKILDSRVEESMICDGCIIKDSSIKNSIIGIRSRIESKVLVENSLLMGADYFQSSAERDAQRAAGIPPIGIGDNSIVRNAIVDKNAHIGKNVRLVNEQNIQNVQKEEEGYWIRSGIITVLKNAVIKDGTVV
jgi:glucose-1-phosphate adenylyltransferase